MTTMKCPTCHGKGTVKRKDTQINTKYNLRNCTSCKSNLPEDYFYDLGNKQSLYCKSCFDSYTGLLTTIVR